MLVSRTSERQARTDAVSGGSVASLLAPPAPRSPSRQPHTGTTGEKQGRLLSLDMLRGIAILLVLGRHIVAPPTGLGSLTPVATTWMRVGWSGVDLFFVLSGFLVSGLIFAEFKRTRQVNIRRFVIRRGFKIWPPYLIYVGFVGCWLAWKRRAGANDGTVWHQLWPNLFHVQNYFHTPRIHTWSLAVEEHFYLAVALGFWWWLSRTRATKGAEASILTGDNARVGAAIRREDSADASDRGVNPLRRSAEPLRGFPWLVAGLVGVLAIVRSVAFLRAGPDVNLYATHLRFDGLLIGTVLAYFTHFRPEALAPLLRHPVTLIGAGILCALPVLVLPPETNVWTAGLGLTGMYVGYGLFLLGWLNLPVRTRWGKRLFETRPAVWLGTVGFYSYSIYLWHVDLAQTPMHKLVLWAGTRGISPGVIYLVSTALYVALAVATGSVMARLIELPTLKLRDRLFPARSKALS